MRTAHAKIDEMNRRRGAAQIIACAVRTHHLRTNYARIRLANSLIIRVWRGGLARATTRDARVKLRTERLAALPKLRSNPFEIEKKEVEVAAGPTTGSETAAAAYFEEQLAAYHMAATGESHPTGSVPDAMAQAATVAPTYADGTLQATLGIEPLGPNQLRAIHALRRRLGEHLEENTTSVGSTQRTVTLPSTGPDQPPLVLHVPERRRLNQPGGSKSGAARTTGPTLTRADPPGGLPPQFNESEYSQRSREEVIVEVALTRDARDGTLGIDLDQFSGALPCASP